MGFINKLVKTFKKKTFVEYGGFELLSRLTGGTGWDKGKMLRQYEKSLYVFSCVKKIAEKVSSTDLKLYQILNSRGDTTEILSHPALDLLYRVNPFQTKSEFLKITMINKLLCGDAFWYKAKNESGRVAELWNLRPDKITIIKDPDNFIKGYKFSKDDGTSEFFYPEEIVHFKYPSPLDEYYGISALSSASTRVETEQFAGNYQRDFFLNQARPDAVLTTPDMVDEEQKKEIRERFEKRHGGIGNNSKVAVLEGDLKYQQISISQKEMDYIESMRFTRDDILVAFHVPKPIVAITDDVNRANAETAMYIFLSETIRPELDMLVEKINEMMIIPDFGENLFIDFPDPTPENREQTLLEYEKGIAHGWLLINEVRQREGLEPIEGGWQFYLPISSVPAGGLSGQASKQLNIEWQKRKSDEAKAKGLKYLAGKPDLKRRLIIAKHLKNEINAQVDEISRSDDGEDGKEKAPASLIKDEDVKNKYAEMVIKQIIRRSDRMKNDVEKLASKEQTELLSLISGIGDLTKAMGKDSKKAVRGFFKEKAEVWAEFSFPFIDEFTRQAGIQAMGMVNPDKGFEITDSIRKKIEKRSKEFGLGVSATTRDKITQAISAGIDAGEGMAEISNRINNVYKEFPTWRSDLIARTESTAANNEGFIEAYKQSDVATHKEWIATLDDRTRDEHLALNGEIVPIDKNFSNGLPYPQEPNCRCVIGPAFEE